MNMNALPIVEKGGVLLCLVLSVVVFGLVCCCVVRCVVAFGLVKEVMGWQYFADVASMSFSKKTISQLAIWFIWGYGVKKSYRELQYDFVFCPTR
jgi:Mn2+/Fe2+ NRAMP family transporter